MNKTIPIGEASAAQLAEYATTVLGLPIKANTPKPTLIAMIQSATANATETITVADESPFPTVDAAQNDAALRPLNVPLPVARPVDPNAVGLRATGSKHDPIVKIQILESPELGGKRPVPVGVNGLMMLIPRGKIVDVPYRYYLVLRDAVSDIVVQDDEGELQVHSVPAYPHQVYTLPSDAEITAWEGKVAERFAA